MIAYLLDQQQHQQPCGVEAHELDLLGAGASAGEDDDESLELAEASTDFGGVVRASPAAVIRPAGADDVIRAVRLAARSDTLTVAARGNGHSVSGQALAAGGLVLDMRAMVDRRINLVAASDGRPCADVPAGTLWSEVLDWGLSAHGLAPASWTDYLRLTVGGTLSVGGISGQAHRRGPQICNVADLEVVTGDGERRICSPSSSPDLFFAVLGGLGQFGIITRARIPLVPAPSRVRWIRVVYADFEAYAEDAEMLVRAAAFDYVEGFAFINSGEDPASGWATVPIGAGAGFDPRLVPVSSGPLLYCLELALYDHGGGGSSDGGLAAMQRPLRYIRGLEFSDEVGYAAFLSRVNEVEAAAVANGSWAAPHPWLNLLVSSADIARFNREVLVSLLRRGIGGPMLVYPLLRSKWDRRMSMAVPEGEVFYLVALLRFSPAYPAGPAAEELVEENKEIVRRCRSNGYDFKVYIPHYETEADWANHFGPDWARFVDRKARYDPLAILAPGQKIFSRRRSSSRRAAATPV